MTETKAFQEAMNNGHSAAWDQLWDKAAAFYRVALSEDPKNPKALSSLALALYQLQDFEEALLMYEKLIKVTPEDPVPYEKKAQLCERLGDIRGAVDAATKSADLYLRQRDVNKAIENWSRVTQLQPEHILSHSRLALVHERLGNKTRAVTEYLALASLMQRSGKEEKARELVARAVKIMPGSQAARQAQTLLDTGKILPKPVRPKGGTGPLRMAQVKQLDKPKKTAASALNPVEEARKKALTTLAEILFEYSDPSDDEKMRTGLQAIMHGTGKLSLKKMEQTKIIMHLGQAIDAQSNHQEELAADELAHALLAGFERSALYFDLGLLRSQSGRADNAIRHLKHVVKHEEFGLAARLLLGKNLRSLSRLKEASIEYLEALKLADVMLIDDDEQAASLRQLYEPLIESLESEEDEEVHLRLCDNVEEMLMQDNWRASLLKAREELPGAKGEVPMPLGEILVQSQSGQVLTSMARVHELARAGYRRSAMDEAFQALTYAPTYLPLHSLIGDLLIQDDRIDDAISKFSVVAEAYSVRGEANQATAFLRKIINLAPMDLSSRTKLIEQLKARGQIDEAIKEYLHLADIYYRLAELDMARKTYTTALREAQQSKADSDWNVRILERMADIDMQRLDWKRAVRVYEQLRTLRPNDVEARKKLIDLHLKLGNYSQGLTELDSYMNYLAAHPTQKNDIVELLQNLINDHSAVPQLYRMLAEQYKQLGEREKAVEVFDAAAEMFLDSNQTDQAIKTINELLSMNPPNAEEYRQVLSQLQSSF